MNTTPLQNDSFNRKASLIVFSLILLFLGGLVAFALQTSVVEAPPHIIQLPPKTKFVSAVWLGGSKLWYSYRPAREGEKPETVIFTNDTNKDGDNYYFNEE